MDKVWLIGYGNEYEGDYDHWICVTDKVEEVIEEVIKESSTLDFLTLDTDSIDEGYICFQSNSYYVYASLCDILQ